MSSTADKKTGETAPTALYSVKSVSEITGINPITLRAWERRYNVVTPQRVDGQRMYSEQEVARLERLARLVARGHRISELARHDAAALAELEAGIPGGGSDDRGIVAGLLNAAADYDLQQIDRRLGALFGSGPLDQRVGDILLALFHEVGQRWRSGAFTITQERLLSQAVKVRVLNILHTLPPIGPVRIVCATPPGEFHELGLLLFAFGAAAQGLTVRYLGPDLPPTEIAHACSELHAPVAAISLTRERPGDEVQALAATLDEVFPDGGPQVWLGGEGAAALGKHLPPRFAITRQPEDTERLLRGLRLRLAADQ